MSRRRERRFTSSAAQAPRCTGLDGFAQVAASRTSRHLVVGCDPILRMEIAHPLSPARRASSLLTGLFLARAGDQNAASVHGVGGASEESASLLVGRNPLARITSCRG